jgi:hypothetical protein
MVLSKHIGLQFTKPNVEWDFTRNMHNIREEYNTCPCYMSLFCELYTFLMFRFFFFWILNFNLNFQGKISETKGFTFTDFAMKIIRFTPWFRILYCPIRSTDEHFDLYLTSGTQTLKKNFKMCWPHITIQIQA